jgi:hypothetical protein
MNCLRGPANVALFFWRRCCSPLECARDTFWAAAGRNKRPPLPSGHDCSQRDRFGWRRWAPRRPHVLADGGHCLKSFSGERVCACWFWPLSLIVDGISTRQENKFRKRHAGSAEWRAPASGTGTTTARGRPAATKDHFPWLGQTQMSSRNELALPICRGGAHCRARYELKGSSLGRPPSGGPG